MRSKNRIFYILYCDGPIRLHLENTKVQVRYLVDSETLVFLKKIRMGILSRNKTTWWKTDTLIDPNARFKQNPT